MADTAATTESVIQFLGVVFVHRESRRRCPWCIGHGLAAKADFGVMPGASSSSSKNSASVASLQDSRPSLTMTWHVGAAQTAAASVVEAALMPSEMSRMLPGRPLCPYGISPGHHRWSLPLGRN